MWSEGIHIVQQAHILCVTWPCSMQITWKLSLSQQSGIKFTYSTLPHNGREEPDGLEAEMVSHWLTRLAIPRVALKDKAPSPFQHFYFHVLHLLCKEHVPASLPQAVWRASLSSHDKIALISCLTTRRAKFTSCVTAVLTWSSAKLTIHSEGEEERLNLGKQGAVFELVNPAPHHLTSLLINTQHAGTWNSSYTDTKAPSSFHKTMQAGRSEHYETALSQDKRLTGMLLWHMRAVDTRVKHWTAHTDTHSWTAKRAGALTASALVCRQFVFIFPLLADFASATSQQS